MAGHIDNEIVIDAPIDLVWKVANDVAGWPQLFVDEYDAVEMLEETGDRKVFRLTMVPDEQGRTRSWVSERIADPETRTVNSRRIETGPFLYMHIFQHFQETADGGVRLRWVQDFEVLPDMPVTTEQIEQRIGANAPVQLARHKYVIESMVSV